MLSSDLVMELTSDAISAPTPKDYLSKDLKMQIGNILSNVEKYLNISKKNMMTQYNTNIRYFDYKQGDKVWVRKRQYKPGEN